MRVSCALPSPCGPAALAGTDNGPLARAVPKGFKLNPAPPNAPPPGKQNAHDNEWLSDRERQKEREERLAYATRAAAEQRQQQEAASRPSTAAVRRPPSELGGRPYSAKPSQVRDDDASSAYAARPSAGGHPVTVQAYANNMANRSPSRPTSAADPGRTGSSSSSRFVSKVKDATSAVAEGEQQGGGGQAQRVGAPSAQMLYPTAFKGSRCAPGCATRCHAAMSLCPGRCCSWGLD